MPVKTCPKCGKGCGPRLRVCECGYPFSTIPAPKETPPAPKETHVIRSNGVLGYRGQGIARMYAPGTGVGKGQKKIVPINPPDDLDRESVTAWIESLQDHAFQERFVYTETALKYMVSYCYECDEKRRLLRELIVVIMKEAANEEVSC